MQLRKFGPKSIPLAASILAAVLLAQQAAAQPPAAGFMRGEAVCAANVKPLLHWFRRCPDPAIVVGVPGDVETVVGLSTRYARGIWVNGVPVGMGWPDLPWPKTAPQVIPYVVDRGWYVVRYENGLQVRDVRGQAIRARH